MRRQEGRGHLPPHRLGHALRRLGRGPRPGRLLLHRHRALGGALRPGQPRGAPPRGLRPPLGRPRRMGHRALPRRALSLLADAHPHPGRRRTLHLHQRRSPLGHSLGGKVAMALAAPPGAGEPVDRGGHRAQGLSGPGAAREIAAMNGLRLDDLHSRAEAELRFEARVPDPALRRFLATNLERDAAGRWRWSINLPALTQALPALVKNPLRRQDRFDGPAHFILCGRSGFVQPEDHAVIRSHFPRAALSFLENPATIRTWRPARLCGLGGADGGPFLTANRRYCRSSKREGGMREVGCFFPRLTNTDRH